MDVGGGGRRQRDTHHGQAGADRGAVSGPGGQPFPERGADDEPADERQQSQPGAERVVAEDQLQVLGQHEQQPEEPEGDQDAGDTAAQEAALAKQAQVNHRIGGAVFPGDEAAQHDGAGGQGGQHQRIAPAASGRLDESVDQAEQPGRRQPRPEKIRATRVRVAGLGQQHHDRRDRENRHRHVDQKD